MKKKNSLLAVMLATMLLLPACGAMPNSRSSAEPSGISNEPSSSQQTEQEGIPKTDGEIEYTELDTSLFNPSKYDGTLYLNGHAFTTPITVADLKEKGIYSKVNSGYDDVIDPDEEVRGDIGLETPITLDNNFSYLDVEFYNPLEEVLNTETQSNDPIQLGAASFDLRGISSKTAYTGVENLQKSDKGDYLLFVEDVISRLGNPKYITGASKEYGFAWYWYVYDNCTIMYELHRDDDYDDRWRVANFYYGLPYRDDEKEILRLTQ